MFAVIYMAFILPEKEAAYQTLWYTVATYFIKHRGAQGSCLHRSDTGQWIAYSRWPDRATRDASWPSRDGEAANDLPADIVSAISQLKQCLDMTRPFEEVCMDVMDDLLLEKLL